MKGNSVSKDIATTYLIGFEVIQNQFSSFRQAAIRKYAEDESSNQGVKAVFADSGCLQFHLFGMYVDVFFEPVVVSKVERAVFGRIKFVHRRCGLNCLLMELLVSLEGRVFRPCGKPDILGQEYGTIGDEQWRLHTDFDKDLAAALLNLYVHGESPQAYWDSQH
ncbi:hypothetical protein MJ923_14885 [Shewanella sp. 3B26]|uniref:Uncharacterized protein n=1 Tax=Shewanella zhuhaiensis TaxID=2919576 RepID=A0AAJ1BKP3_9GAMM|nr:hypothetical protein [Shewanella zhuhaiensis]MCH4295592.1 hypothetical protein [Shewanella zhuhaiensis]